MNKHYVKISVIFQIISTVFLPYYLGLDNGGLKKAFGFPYGYIYFSEMKDTLIQSMNIDLSCMLIDFLLIYLCIRVVMKLFNLVKSVIIGKNTNLN